MKLQMFDDGSYIITFEYGEIYKENNKSESEELKMKNSKKELVANTNTELVENSQDKKRELTKEEKKEIRKQKIVIGCLIALVVVLAVVYFSGVRFFVPQAVVSFYENSDGFLRTLMDWVLKVLDFFRGLLGKINVK